MSKKSKAKENKQLSNFDHNVKMYRKMLVEQGINKRKLAAALLKNEVMGIEYYAQDEGSTFSDLQDHVIATMALTHAIMLHFKSLGFKSSGKHLKKPLKDVVTASRVLHITKMISDTGAVKVKRIKKIEVTEAWEQRI
jgi:hypothetical protein